MHVQLHIIATPILTSLKLTLLLVLGLWFIHLQQVCTVPQMIAGRIFRYCSAFKQKTSFLLNVLPGQQRNINA